MDKSKDLTNYMFPIDTSIKANTTIRKDTFDYYPKYLYDYATMSLIPSGSTFKPMTAIAGLESGVINGNSTYDDKGGYDMAAQVNWRKILESFHNRWCTWCCKCSKRNRKIQ